MADNQFLDVIKTHGDAIILAEIGALLHDIGKLANEFVQMYKNPVPVGVKKYHHHLVLQRQSRAGEPVEALDDNKKKILKKEEMVPADFLSSDLIALFDSIQVPLLAELVNSTGMTAVNLGDFIALHHSPAALPPDETPLAVQLLLATRDGVDGLDSGVDKGAPKGKQDGTDTFLASAFGFEQKLPDLTPLRKKLDEDLVGEFKNLNDRTETARVARARILQAVRVPYQQALGETRRPANDVTLWDHSYSVASLYKSALAGWLLDITNGKHAGELAQPKDIKWRILRVNLDILKVYSKAHKVGDILGYQQELLGLGEHVGRLFEQVKRIVEVDYPLGNEIYRDESGIYFTFPECAAFRDVFDGIKPKIESVFKDFDVMPVVALSEDSSRSLTALAQEIDTAYKHDMQRAKATPTSGWISDWEEWVGGSGISDADFAGWLREHVKTKECSSREGLCEDAKSCLAGEAKGRNRPAFDICPICGVRPKCELQKVCKSCSERRVSTLQRWLERPGAVAAGADVPLSKHTIWLGEVADSNGRLAILTGHFTLTNWLNGKYVDSMKMQVPGTGGESCAYACAGCTAENYQGVVELLKCMEEGKKNNSVLHFDEGYRAVMNEQRTLEQYIDVTLRDRYFRGVVPTKPTAEQFAQLYLTKNPSPARLRRVWETTQKFWVETVGKKLISEWASAETALPSPSSAGFRRRAIFALTQAPPARYRRQSVDATIQLRALPGGRSISVVTSFYITEDGKYAINTDYSPRLAEIAQSASERRDRTQLNANMVLEQPTLVRSGRKNNVRDWSTGAQMLLTWPEGLEHLAEYNPYVPILASPMSFMAIVPGAGIPTLLKKITDAYQDEFCKVQNRLPLHMRVVFFKKRQPLYTAIDASRRLLRCWKDLEGNELAYAVYSKNPLRLRPVHENLSLTGDLDLGDSRRLTQAGDGSDKDKFNAVYFAEAEHISSRKSYFKTYHLNQETGNESLCDAVLAPDLDPGDKVWFTPSTFDYEFLESSAARFDIDKLLRASVEITTGGSVRGPRPYLLSEALNFADIWRTLCDSGVSESQLYNLLSMWAKAFVDWRLDGADGASWQPDDRLTSFKSLVRAGLIETGLATDEKLLNVLVEAISTGRFFDTIEFYVKILKHRLAASGSPPHRRNRAIVKEA